jgi:hypothetical protein
MLRLARRFIKLGMLAGLAMGVIASVKATIEANTQPSDAQPSDAQPPKEDT